MADIFLSYARADAARIEPLVRALKARWTVFWDRTIPPGKTWDDYIGGELERSRTVVVVWSHTSVGSEWVREEAHHGRDRGVLVPLLIDPVQPPFGFRQVQAANLAGWNGGPSDALDLLMRSLEELIAPASTTVEPQVPAAPPSNKTREAPPVSVALPPNRTREARPVAPPAAAAAHVEVSVPVMPRERIAPAIDVAPTSWAAPRTLRSPALLVAAVVAIILVIGIVWLSGPGGPRVVEGEGFRDFLHAEWVRGVAFNEDGSQLAAVVENGDVYLWPLQSPEPTPTLISVSSTPERAAFHPTRSLIALTGAGITLWTLDDLTAQPVRPPPESDRAYDNVAFSADGRLLAGGGMGIGLWRVTDTLTLETIASKSATNRRFAMALSPDGRWLAADTEEDSGLVDVWQTNFVDGQPTGISEAIVVGPNRGTAWGAAFDHASRTLAVAASDGIHLWDVNSLGAEPRTLTRNETWSVAFSPDDRTLAAGDETGVTLWHLDQATPTKTYLGSADGRVDSVAYSPDSRMVAAASSGKKVRLFTLK